MDIGGRRTRQYRIAEPGQTQLVVGQSRDIVGHTRDRIGEAACPDLESGESLGTDSAETRKSLWDRDGTGSDTVGQPHLSAPPIRGVAGQGAEGVVEDGADSELGPGAEKLDERYWETLSEPAEEEVEG
jgi:hypothetical protein